MTMRKLLLPSSFISKPFLPCFSTLLLLLKPLLQALHSQATTAITDSFSFAPFIKSMPTCDEETGIFHYKQAPGEQLLCVFCMSDVGDGEKVRKLDCSHLFHSSCLDKWLAHRRTDCPLCRRSPVLFDDEADDSAPPLLAFVQREWPLPGSLCFQD
ncbi:hypothetical protein KSP39_PZI001357 [Platanthera zijinensis]|uniref:RING-type domain-containing protein n=1 Tax=Platanthera zijinensis TaxID=2320716 RepID=A0AAP0C1V0_9ASPA